MALTAPARTDGGRRAAPHSSPRPTRLALVNARRLAERTQRRRARAMSATAAVILAGALLLIVAGQALVASQQVHLNGLESSLQQATAANENLELERAQLSTPAQVLQIASAPTGESVFQANALRSR